MSGKDRNQMFANTFFKLSMYVPCLHIVAMFANSDLLQEIFAIDIWKALWNIVANMVYDC